MVRADGRLEHGGPNTLGAGTVSRLGLGRSNWGKAGVRQEQAEFQWP